MSIGTGWRTLEEEQEFLVRVFKLYTPRNQKSRISLVAHKREVSGSVLHKYIPEFEEEFYERDGNRLLSMCFAAYHKAMGRCQPGLLLLDEVDAVLHPSMISALIAGLREQFVDNGTAVIMATHSVTTASLVDEVAIFRVSRSGGRVKVFRVTKSEAVAELSEGLATIDAGLKIAASESTAPITIMSEGKNTLHLDLAKIAQCRGDSAALGLRISAGHDAPGGPRRDRAGTEAPRVATGGRRRSRPRKHRQRRPAASAEHHTGAHTWTRLRPHRRLRAEAIAAADG